jgi:NADP-dependent 3-hydroxy acid dehydrogenase YdfG
MLGKVVVVTGASSGIGAELSKVLVSKGAKVVLASRNVDALNRVASECSNSENVLVHQCDVTKRADHEAVLTAAIERFGQVHSWVNNAGVGMSKPVIDVNDEDVDLMISLNTKSVLFGMQTAVRHYKTIGTGQVINVSSLLGRYPAASARAMYSASKAATNSLTANMRMDVLNEGFTDIHIALFTPGVVGTPFGLNSLYGGVDNSKLPNAQDVHEVAEIIANMIESPATSVDVYSRPAYKDAVISYYTAEDIRDVEAKMMPPVVRPNSSK